MTTKGETMSTPPPLASYSDAEIMTATMKLGTNVEIMSAAEGTVRAERRGDTEAAEAHAARARGVDAERYDAVMSLINAGALPCPCCNPAWRMMTDPMRAALDLLTEEIGRRLIELLDALK